LTENSVEETQKMKNSTENKSPDHHPEILKEENLYNQS